MGCMNLLGMALLGALAVLATLASSSPAAKNGDPARLTVKCDTTGRQQQTTVTVAHTTLQVTCPSSKYRFEPAAGGTARAQEVYVDAQCNKRKALSSYCPSATGRSSPQNGNPGLVLTIAALPAVPATFYVHCKAPEGTADRNCVVEVAVMNLVAGGQRQVRELAEGDHQGGEEPEGPNDSPKPEPPPAQDTTPNNGGEAGKPGAGGSQTPDDDIKPENTPPGAGGTAGSGGTAGVQTCEQPNTSITIRISEKGSSAQFGCKSGFTLYPKEANKVFAKDCKKQETLKDMIRTEEPAIPSPSGPGAAGPSGDNQGTPPQGSDTALRGGSGAGGQTAAPQPVIYTLRADNKPSKKKLCYLCAQKGVSEQNPGTAQNYCAIYVESGAHTQLGRGLTFALMLPCVLAVL